MRPSSESMSAEVACPYRMVAFPAANSVPPGSGRDRLLPGNAVAKGSGVLRLAFAERPVLLRDFDQIDEHILRPDAGIFFKLFDNAREQRLLLRHAARVADG